MLTQPLLSKTFGVTTYPHVIPRSSAARNLRNFGPKEVYFTKTLGILHSLRSFRMTW